jgi:tetratricopeptide (TPR) repeat protein
MDDQTCPDAERLAEYIEGTLRAAERQQFEAHFVSCAACREVVAEAAVSAAAMQMTEASVPPGRMVPFRSRWWIKGLGVALAAAATLVVVIRVTRPPSAFPSVSPTVRQFPPSAANATDPLELTRLRLNPPNEDPRRSAQLSVLQTAASPELAELVAALSTESTRPVEGRITGFPYAPPPSIPRGPEDRQVSPDVRIAAAKVEKLAQLHRDPEQQAELGIAFLAVGEFDKAVQALEEAVRRAPSNASLQNDLAAAYLARARREDRDDDLRQALSAAERAVQIAPQLNEPYFNRALALEWLHRQAQAVTAWNDLAKREPASPWAAEAKLHLSPKPTAPH